MIAHFREDRNGRREGIENVSAVHGVLPRGFPDGVNGDMTTALVNPAPLQMFASKPNVRNFEGM